jgi:hypothetical protein
VKRLALLAFHTIGLTRVSIFVITASGYARDCKIRKFLFWVALEIEVDAVFFSEEIIIPTVTQNTAGS